MTMPSPIKCNQGSLVSSQHQNKRKQETYVTSLFEQNSNIRKVGANKCVCSLGYRVIGTEKKFHTLTLILTGA